MAKVKELSEAKVRSNEAALSFEGQVSLTKQSDAASCDINNIMKNYERTGQLPTVLGPEGFYADVSEFGDFRECQEVVLRAQEAFMSLDARVRARFGNDPAQMLDFVSDEKNRAEAIDLGLVAELAKADSAAAVPATDVKSKDDKKVKE